MALQVGQVAPDFTLFDSDSKPFHLVEALAEGPVLLLFFPGAFTSVCTTELNAVNNDYARYNTVRAQVVGVSTDSPFVLAEYRRVHGFQFRLLSDHDAAVSSLYGAKYDRDFTAMNLDRISRRAAFLIDRNGLLRFAEVLENAGHLPDFESLHVELNLLGESSR